MIMVIGHHVIHIGTDPGELFPRLAPELKKMRVAGWYARVR